jgi:hypothetical protein
MLEERARLGAVMTGFWKRHGDPPEEQTQSKPFAVRNMLLKSIARVLQSARLATDKLIQR